MLSSLLSHLPQLKKKSEFDMSISIPKSIHDMAVVNERFGSAVATFVPRLTTNPTDDAKVKSLVSQGKREESVRSLVVTYDASDLFPFERSNTMCAPPRIASVNPVTNEMTVVFPVGIDGKDAFPEGVHHSKSIACIVWRENGSGEKEVLLVTEKAKDYTSFVAGGLEWQENSVNGCIREVYEEVGLDLDVSTMEWIATVEMPRKLPYGELNTLNTFACEAKNGWDQEIVLQEEEIKDAKWYDLSDAMKIVPFESARRALVAFAEGRGRPIEVQESCSLWLCG